jgi:hypothetical protein
MQKLGVMPGKDAAQYADAVGQFLMDRYGSKYAILKTLVTDPVRIVVDVSTVLSAGGSLAVRAPGFVSRIGHAVATAGQLTIPLNAVTPAFDDARERPFLSVTWSLYYIEPVWQFVGRAVRWCMSREDVTAALDRRDEAGSDLIVVHTRGQGVNRRLPFRMMNFLCDPIVSNDPCVVLC